MATRMESESRAFAIPVRAARFFGLAQLSPFTKKSKAWRDLMALPTIQDRVAAMKKPEVRAALISEGQAAGDLKQLAPMLHPFGTAERPDLDFDRKGSLAQLAEAEGKDPVEVYVDRLLASEGREYFNFWMFGGNLENQWEYMRLPHVVPMLGDAGAHVGFFTDTDSPTVLLSDLTRDRGVYTLEEAVHRITGKSAEIIGSQMVRLNCDMCMLTKALERSSTRFRKRFMTWVP